RPISPPNRPLSRKTCHGLSSSAAKRREESSWYSISVMRGKTASRRVRRPRAGAPSEHSFRTRIDVESISLQEADERDTELFRELDRERRRRADCREQRAAGHHRFLHQLEARAAADDDAVLGDRQRAGHESIPDELVERVVAADVLAHEHDAPVAVE